MGGDLAGIIQKLDYIRWLGANVVCLTPIFLSRSNHRYNTRDYYSIDPRAGDLGTFRRLLSEAHRRGIRVILDGTFNHCGRDFFPFTDVVQKSEGSVYRDWFYVDGFPLFIGGKHRYAAWQDVADLPELRLAHPQTQRYFLDVATYWTRWGVDGWRLDAVRHVRHRPFWRALRDAVRRVRPDAYLLAEIWEDAQPWLDRGDFSGATNYPLREVLFEFVVHHRLAASQFARSIERQLQRVPWQTTLGMLNLLGSHDTPRLWNATGGDVDTIKLLALLQFVIPGVPAIYYGDEVGMEGGEDPDNRRAMIWDSSLWNTELQSHMRCLSALRRSREALKAGDWRCLWSDDQRQAVAFLRRTRCDIAVIVINGGKQALDCSLPLPLRGNHLPFADALGAAEATQRNGNLQVRQVAARGGAIFVPIEA